MSKLVLIDGNAIMHRAYHALPPLTSRSGKQINAVYGLISVLLRTIQDLKPTHIAFCFDTPEPTFRKEINKEYQAHRPEMETMLSDQFQDAYDVIAAFGIPIYMKPGFEADDVIGTITKKADIDDIVILTGDRDILQLVSPKVKLFMPDKGLSHGKLYGKKETIERMGVPPSQIVDYKALVGDPSDNYKGVPGIGPKTAIKLLQGYKTLENVYDNLDNIPDKIAKLLKKEKKSALLSQELAKIIQDVDIDFDLSDCNRWKVDSNEAVNAFEKYNFKTLAKRAKEVGKQIVSENQMKLL